MKYDDEMLSDEGSRGLALHITRGIIDTVRSKHDAKDDCEFAAQYEATPAETYYKLLSEAHQNTITAGMTRETRSGACSIG
jgi:hypothetical protein